MNMYLLYHPPKFQLKKIRLTVDFLYRELNLLSKITRRQKKAEKKSSKTVSALESQAKEIGSSELQNMMASLKRKSKVKK